MIMHRLVLYSIMLVSTVSLAQRLVNGECQNGFAAYQMVEDKQLVQSTVTVYRAMTQRQCMKICTDNMDLTGTKVECASFVYNEDYSVCKIYQSRALPDGPNSLIAARRTIYFEKFCIPDTNSERCENALFSRVAQKVLVGYARNVTVARTLAECVQFCVAQNLECKSAAYFYEVGECITNVADKIDFPDVFLSEDNERVVYFDNGCTFNTIFDNNLLVVEEGLETGEKPVQLSTKSTKRPAATTSTKATTTTTPTTTTTTQASTTPTPEDGSRYTAWSEWSLCDRPDGRRIRTRDCIRGQCQNKLQVQWCSKLDPLELTTTTTTTTAATTTTSTQSSPPTTTSIVPFEQQGWAEFSPFCLPFNDGQSCGTDGMIIGFQTRQCIGSPFQCVGPFFRYCTIKC